MAQVEKINTIEIVEVQKVVPTFIIELAEDEATVLADALFQVAGIGRGRALSKLRGQLLTAGVERGKRSWDADKDFEGSIRFFVRP